MATTGAGTGPDQDWGPDQDRDPDKDEDQDQDQENQCGASCQDDSNLIGTMEWL